MTFVVFTWRLACDAFCCSRSHELHDSAYNMHSPSTVADMKFFIRFLFPRQHERLPLGALVIFEKFRRAGT